MNFNEQEQGCTQWQFIAGVDPDYLADEEYLRKTGLKAPYRPKVWQTYDGIECSCGNTPEAQGFYPSSSTGAEMEPLVKYWTEHYTCDRCYHVFSIKDILPMNHSEPVCDPGCTGDPEKCDCFPEG